ncbi:helix-turn-helix transcriptional regulator [Clostridium sp. JS66]|uniref:helix-turn-helix domain-containing protein n=1 Tax=Clostridium sp. JS66 TaxID=3064705 RepID=UPI00298DE9EB|nr:helix-turn-helix transcriptional regulator [Clostridium sp. JS66]WPC42379.1 helix-turn-helix transcriptional regulator [Clostridium sp. JS66]
MNNSINYKELGIRLKLERKKMGFTREKLAELIGVTTAYIGVLERGEKRMTVDTLVNISNCLHVTTDYLITGEKPPSKEGSHLIELLSGCSESESNALYDIIRVTLPYLKK